MKRVIAWLSVCLMLFAMMPVVSADDKYNDDTLNWGEHTVHVYTDCSDLSCNVCGALRSSGHIYDHECDTDCNSCGAIRVVEGHAYNHACDPDCNHCGFVREITHVYVDCYDETCNLCGAVRQVSDHVYANVCDRDCNVCGITRTPPHAYDNACDAECNLCGTLRRVEDHVYDNACDTTCNICDAVRTVEPHVYDHACDVDCNVCGETRDISHTYDNACDGVCNVCGLTREPSAHVYDTVCDATCNECGATRQAQPHVYDFVCDSTCNICGTVREVSNHVYSDLCDRDCNVCGEERVPPHVYDNACDDECNCCGEIREPFAHVYDNAADEYCNVCGEERELNYIYEGYSIYSGKEFVFEPKQSGRYRFEFGTCDGYPFDPFVDVFDAYDNRIPYTNDAYHGPTNGYYDLLFTLTFTAGERYILQVSAYDRFWVQVDYLCDHAYDNACDANCNICDALRSVPPHVYDNGNDTECNVCGTHRDACNHQYDHACDASCNVVGCGYVRPVGEHIYNHACDTDCNVCGAIRVITHDYADATCTTPKTCSVCGATEGDALGHSMNTDVTIEPTCKEEGVLTHWCSLCDYAQSELIPKLAHTSDEGTVTQKATCTATGIKTYKCTACGEVLKTETIAKLSHSYEKKITKATLTKDGTIKNVCSKCGYTASKVTTIYKTSKISLSQTSYTYNGKVQKPTVIVKDSKGKTISSSNYTVKFASGLKNAGTYKVTVTLKGNYTGTKTLTYKINPIDISKCRVTQSDVAFTYNGKVQRPTITVKNASGTKLVKDTHYTVTCSAGSKNVGTYKVTIEMKGNYTGTDTLVYTINPINYHKCKITLSKTVFTYNGKVQKPTVTVKNASGTTLKKGTHYTVTYSTGCKNVGTYKVTIKMKGNYSGTKVLTFKINPVKTSISKLTAGKKSLKVTVAKKSTQVSGYQIQYSTSKTFKPYTTKSLGSYTKTSLTLSSLKAKTTYYVRVRTYKKVGNTFYYSGWSTVKILKTK